MGAFAAALAAVIALAGCNSDDSGTAGSGGSGSQETQVAAAPAEITITPDDGTKKVKTAKKVKVAVAEGTISDVRVASATGSKIKGSLNADKTEWTSKTKLKAATGYTVAVTAANTDGVAAEKSASFSTIVPDGQVTAYTVPGNGWTVGVGMPIVVHLSKAVSESKRDAVVDALKVDTGDDKIEGAWAWIDSQQVWYRPKDYWPTGTKVKVTADLTGVEVQNGVWGKKQKTQSKFSIGSEMISTVDVAKHTMTVRKDGKVIKTIPVTTGKASMATRNGIKVIMSRETVHTMRSSTVGIPEDSEDGYNIDAKFAMRLTNSGEFIHAADWSTGSQGRANVSHGCTGMSDANAKWLFDRSKVGDVVVYKNSTREMEKINGYSMWNTSWSGWQKFDA
ncbi:Ig-like domain-containing protein [Kineosporia succinea]